MEMISEIRYMYKVKTLRGFMGYLKDSIPIGVKGLKTGIFFKNKSWKIKDL
jgi:hypothetical protein